MYKYIVNPVTNQKENINNKNGKTILRNYINQLGRGVKLDNYDYDVIKNIDDLININKTLFNINIKIDLKKIEYSIKLIKNLILKTKTLKKYKNVIKYLDYFIKKLKRDESIITYTQSGGAEEANENNENNEGGEDNIRQVWQLEPKDIPENERQFLEVDPNDIPNEDCPICLDKLSNKSVIRCPNNVPHMVHRECINVWINEQNLNKCSICRLEYFPLERIETLSEHHGRIYRNFIINVRSSTTNDLVKDLISELKNSLQYEITQDILEFDRGLMLLLSNIMISGLFISNQEFGIREIGSIMANYQYYYQISKRLWGPRNFVLVELLRELYLRMGF